MVAGSRFCTSCGTEFGQTPSQLAPEKAPANESEKPAPTRYHDLDALRGFVMLLGIGLHAAIPFVPYYHGFESSPFMLFVSFVHGFRMPLFFLLSGFFTTMLWHRHGLGALLKHRLRRVVLPLVISVFTILPALAVAGIVGVVISDVGSDGFNYDNKFREDELAPEVTREKNAGTDALVTYLTNLGFEVRVQKDAEGYKYPVFDEVLVQAINAFSAARFAEEAATWAEDDKAEWNDRTDEFIAHFAEEGIAVETTTVVPGLLNIIWTVELEAKRGQSKVVQALFADKIQFKEGDAFVPIESGAAEEGDTIDFAHLWFLWFLVWLLVCYAAITSVLKWSARIRGRDRLVQPWMGRAVLWCLPLLTLVPQLLMVERSFGADTSTRLVPALHVLIYYGCFFGFGALAFRQIDRNGLPLIISLGHRWRMLLAVSAIALFGPGLVLIDSSWPLSSVFQVTFAWTMAFGLIGMFRSLLSSERYWVRFLSDASYWMYLAHLPLILVAQGLVANWNISVLARFVVICLLVTAVLWFSYRYLVRYTPIGTLLNGKRTRDEDHARRVALQAALDR